MNYYMIVNTATLKAHKELQQYKYHLVLAQVLKQDPEYFTLIRSMIANGTQIILDNGVHEGIVCSLSDYFEVAQSLKPQCVVLPDLIGAHAIESRTRSLTFYHWMRQAWGTSYVMYVPQGLCQREIVDEFLWSLEYFQEHLHMVCIGIGDAYKYCYTAHDTANSRAPEEVKVRLVEDMIAECAATKVQPRMHILGGRATPSLFYSQQSNIVGIDSVDPCRCALNGQIYPIEDTEFERATRQPFNFADPQAAGLTILQRNIQEFCTAYGANF